MVEQATVERKKDDAQRDAAPPTAEQLLKRSGADVPSQAPEKLIDPSPGKRKKTKGEVLFDWTTYGGISWILNEAISTVIGLTVLKPPKDPNSTSWMTGMHKSIHNGYMSLVDNVHKVSPFQDKKNWTQRTLHILVLCIGGTLLVPLVKWFEDRKSKLVRTADDVLEGKRAKTDPEIVKAHEDMDQAPKQTWRSLFEGRGVVMGTAILLDIISGNDGSPTTKWLANTPFKNYSNMERAGTTLTRDVLGAPIINFWNKNRDTIREMRRTNPLAPIDPAREGKAAEFGGLAGFVLILSGALTILFYVSSKIFAVGQAKRTPKQEEASKHAETAKRHLHTDQLEKVESKGQDDEKKTPATKIGDVANLERMAAAPQVQPSMSAG